jgi:CBS domain-containing protein
VQVRDVMTHEVVTVGPDTSAKYAAEVMTGRGYAALPVVDDDRRVVGIVAEVDVLRERIPQDPRLHLRREAPAAAPPPTLVRGVMTSPARTVPVTADIADVARLFLDQRLRSVPVVDGERLAGIVSRRDVLRTLVRSDDEIATDVRRLVESYTGGFDDWQVRVAQGAVTLSPRTGAPASATGTDAASEERAVLTLARTVPGVVHAGLEVPAPDAVLTSLTDPEGAGAATAAADLDESP